MTEAEWKAKTAAFLAELAQLYDKHGMSIGVISWDDDCHVRLAPLEVDGANEVTFIDSSYCPDDHK